MILYHIYTDTTYEDLMTLEKTFNPERKFLPGMLSHTISITENGKLIVNQVWETNEAAEAFYGSVENAPNYIVEASEVFEHNYEKVIK